MKYTHLIFNEAVNINRRLEKTLHVLVTEQVEHHLNGAKAYTQYIDNTYTPLIVQLFKAQHPHFNVTDVKRRHELRFLYLARNQHYLWFIPVRSLLFAGIKSYFHAKHPEYAFKQAGHRYIENFIPVSDMDYLTPLGHGFFMETANSAKNPHLFTDACLEHLFSAKTGSGYATNQFIHYLNNQPVKPRPHCHQSSKKQK